MSLAGADGQAQKVPGAWGKERGRLVRGMLATHIRIIDDTRSTQDAGTSSPGMHRQITQEGIAAKGEEGKAPLQPLQSLCAPWCGRALLLSAPGTAHPRSSVLLLCVNAKNRAGSGVPGARQG
jgi:hypothetical protein